MVADFLNEAPVGRIDMLKKGYFMMVLMEEIPNNHLDFIKPCRKWDKLPTSTGDRRISEPSTVFQQFTSHICCFRWKLRKER